MPYTFIDRQIAHMRFREAYRHIRKGSRVCDLGCGLEGAFLNYAAERIAEGTGIDDQVTEGAPSRWKLLRADLQGPLPLADGAYDHVVMLAVLEHLRQPEGVLRECHRVLAPGGTLILTWPSSVVDPILGVLHALGLISDEMESDEHQKRIAVNVLKEMLTKIGFDGFLHKRFELGMNNLMVAERSKAQT